MNAALKYPRPVAKAKRTKALEATRAKLRAKLDASKAAQSDLREERVLRSDRDAELLGDLGAALNVAYWAAQEAKDHDVSAVLMQVIELRERDPAKLAKLANAARKWSERERRRHHKARGERGPRLLEVNDAPSRKQALDYEHLNLDQALAWYSDRPDEWEALPIVLARGYLKRLKPLMLEGLGATTTPTEADLAARLARKLEDRRHNAKELLSACLQACGVSAARARTALANIEHATRTRKTE